MLDSSQSVLRRAKHAAWIANDPSPPALHIKALFRKPYFFPQRTNPFPFRKLRMIAPRYCRNDAIILALEHLHIDLVVNATIPMLSGLDRFEVYVND